VHRIQAGFKVRPISRFGQAVEAGGRHCRSRRRHEDPAEDPGRHDAGRQILPYAAEIPKLQPSHITDEPILAQMQRIGIERGKSFDIDSSIRRSRPRWRLRPRTPWP
jgi:hypothetical protein